MSLVKIADVDGVTMDVIDIEGFKHPYFFKPPEVTKRIFENVPNFRFREDDIMLCSFPKTGSNWLFEILMMILQRSPERVQTKKAATMMELCSKEEIDQVHPPRVISAHYQPRHLPLVGLREKQIKTILMLRNPKDVAVSYYNHMSGLNSYNYSGQWKDWLPAYIQGQFEFGKYSDYLLSWEQLVDQGAGFPLYVIYYENLKLNGLCEVDKLLEFLNKELDATIRRDIMCNCGFETMRKEKNVIPEDGIDIFYKKTFNFFRKGEVGDWMNWFTVSQNEMFDNIWKSDTKDSTRFTFTYTS